MRYLCANTHPDHDSICAFRTANETAFQAAFVSVLQLAQHLRLTQVGTVAAVEQKPDGTGSGPTVYAAVEKHSHHRSVADLLPHPSQWRRVRKPAPKISWRTD